MEFLKEIERNYLDLNKENLLLKKCPFSSLIHQMLLLYYPCIQMLVKQ